jgi:hypothetical protein
MSDLVDIGDAREQKSKFTEKAFRGLGSELNEIILNRPAGDSPR